MTSLASILARLDGRPYPAYRDLEGEWSLGETVLHVDHVQGDPFAAPSRVRVVRETGIPSAWLDDPVARCAAEDWLLRRFGDGLEGASRGSGRSGALGVYRPGPEVCERSVVRLDPSGRVTVRFTAGLPARGRRILGRQAEAMLCDDVPDAARRLVVGADPTLEAHITSVRRQRALRDALVPAGLIAFVEDGSVLPRASGVDRGPLVGAVPFESPASLRVTLHTPFGSAVGMGIPAGVTVVTGGGFHGKSTVLAALQEGHLDHVPGDGREGVVALPDTVKVRAEDGRAVRGVDISAFLGDLPGGRSTTWFDTDDASGSTSQAAAMVEAIETGAKVLLLDEDTSATNLLVRDARMAALIPDDREPITPFVRRVRQLHAERGVSTVFVIGGVGDYLAAADVVIAMTEWRPSDVTARARELAPERPVPPGPLPSPAPRCPRADGLEGRVRARDTRAVSLDREEIDLTAVEQVLDAAHSATLGHALRFLGGLADGRRSVPQLLDALDAILDDEGIEALSPFREPPGTLVRPRRHEIAAALNRFRGLRLARRATTPGDGR
ncbi:MAG: ABC-ATPase domain-containing protein [Alphaproteobacteria bacterium]|nr:ABC-ATPase domain-containing protein [Alphaproteobacteria bacterium]